MKPREHARVVLCHPSCLANRQLGHQSLQNIRGAGDSVGERNTHPSRETGRGRLVPGRASFWEVASPTRTVLVRNEGTREASPLSGSRLGRLLLSVTLSTAFHNFRHSRDSHHPTHVCHIFFPLDMSHPVVTSMPP